MTAEVVHDNVEFERDGVAGAQLLEDFQHICAHLARVDFTDKTVGVDVIEGQELLGALKPAVGSTQAFGMMARPPRASVDRSQLQRTTLVEADYGPSLRRSVVKVEDTVFFTSNSGSGDSFQ